MADNIDFSRFAGRVVFPRTPSDLLNTDHCPACFTLLASTTCSSCGLNVSNPVAAELHDVSLAVAAGLERRLAIIGQIRYESEQASAPQVHSAPAAASILAPPPPPVFSGAPLAKNASVAPAAGTKNAQIAPAAKTVTPPTSTDPTRRRQSSVQVTMLMVGVSLLSVAAIYFLVFAYLNFGIIWQSVIIAALTAAVIATATILRRRQLPATAEGIAVFGVVLLYLDAFALRANNLFQLANVDGYLYWGAAILVLSAALMFWSRASGLRSPSIVGFSAFAPGVGVFVAGLTREAELGTQAFLTAAAIAAAGLIHRWALPAAPNAPHSPSPIPSPSPSPRTAERLISLSTTVVALAAGFFLAMVVAPDSDWAGTFAVTTLVMIAAAHLWAITPTTTAGPTRAFANILSSMAAVFAASALLFAAFRIGSDAFTVTAPVIAAAIVVLACETFSLRGAVAWRKFGTIGAVSALVIFALAVIKPVTVAGLWLTLLPSLGLAQSWAFAATDAPSLVIEHPGWSVLSLAIVGALTAASWIYARVIRMRGPILVWFGAAVLIAAVPLLAILWLIVLGWLVIAVACISLLSIPRTRAMVAGAYRNVMLTTAIGSAFFAYLIGWASVSTWWVASLVVVALLLASRLSVARHGAKAALLAVATVLVLIASFAAAMHIDFVAHAHHLTFLSTTNGLRFASVAAVILFLLFAVPLGRTVTNVDRRVMFWLTGGSAVLLLGATWAALTDAGVTGRDSLILPEHATSFVAQLIMLVALVAWVALAPAKTLLSERNVAAILTAPAAYCAVVALTKVTVLPEFVIAVAPITASLVVAAVALTTATLRPSSPTRGALDVGVVLVALPSVVYSAIFGGRFAWFVLILSAVTVLLLATSRDGLFASASPRKHLGWLALALATAGLWWQLGNSRVDALEPYVLPLGGALLATALLIAWSEVRRARKNPQDDGAQAALTRSAAPLVALGGLVVATLPLAINAVTGSLAQAVIIAAVSAALLLAGSLFFAGRKQTESGTAGIRWQPWLDAAALAGALGVIVTPLGRAALASPFEWAGELWLGSALVVLVAAGLGQARSARATAGPLRAASSQALAVIPLTAVLVLEIAAFDPGQLGSYRALGLIILFAAVTVLCFAVNRAPFGRVVGGVSAALWAIASIATLQTFTADLLLALAPIASALLVAAVALATTVLGIGSTARWTRDLGVIIVSAVSVLFSIFTLAPHTWLVLILAGVAMLLLAVDRDGLFASTSNRRHLGWLALALGTGGLWWRLSQNDVTDLLPYVLPLAGALILIAILVELAKARTTADEPPKHTQAAPLIALGGLLVAILPLAITASGGTTLRAVVIGIVSAVLLLAGSFIAGGRAAQRWWDSAAIAGGAGVLILMIGRAIFLPVTDVARDAWIIGGFIVLLAAAFGQALARNTTTDRIRGAGSEAFGLVAMAAVLLTEIPAFRDSVAGQYRVLGLVTLFGAAHVLALILRRAPLSPRVGWSAIAMAGIAGLFGLTLGAVDTIEFVTVPIAVALLATGTMHLRRVATAPSWPWLAPGLIVLLLPTLFENLREQEMWRIVGLGVVSVAVIIIGLVRKLQAPFVIGVIVVLVHGIATFLPQLRAAYEFVPWWLWLGLAGAVLFAISVRYERRLRDMKAVIMRFNELR